MLHVWILIKILYFNDDRRAPQEAHETLGQISIFLLDLKV